MATSENSFRSPTTTPMLPPEKWHNIFQFLGPEDLYSVTKTCPEWKELLKEKRNTFLVPLVLPFVMKYLDTKTTLNFRKVSKPAKHAVDVVLQSFSNSDDDNPFGFHYEEPSNIRNLRTITLKISNNYVFNINNANSVYFESFIAKMFPEAKTTASSGTNPFLIKHIEYSSKCSNDIAQGNPLVLNILPKFGHHLSSIKCHVFRDTTENPPYTKFVSQLRLVPNLKRLVIDLKIPGENSLCTRSSTSTSTDAYDFPSLPKLVLLDVRFVDGYDDISSSFAVEMLKMYGQQLTAFTSKASLIALSSLSLEVLNTSFPNLKKLHLLGQSSQFPEALNKLSKVSWSLEKLKLEVEKATLPGYIDSNLWYLPVLEEDRREIRVRDLISTLKNFQKCLVHLELDCILFSIVANEDTLQEGHEFCKMSKLKTFVTNPFNLQLNSVKRFLQNSCQSLRQIHFQEGEKITWLHYELGRWTLKEIENVEKVFLWDNTDPHCLRADIIQRTEKTLR